MERFEVILPSTCMKAYVKEYWFLSASKLTNAGQRAVPSGCIALSFKRGGDIFSIREGCTLPSACVFGQTTNFK